MIIDEQRITKQASACAKFAWCDGHEPNGDDDGGHRTTIDIGRYEDGAPKRVTVWRMLPTPGFDEPAHWEISMPSFDEWVFGPEDIDKEIDEAVKELESARNELRAFMQQQVSHA